MLRLVYTRRCLYTFSLAFGIPVMVSVYRQAVRIRQGYILYGCTGHYLCVSLESLLF